MATIKKFEELICWQKARELTRGVYKICRYVEMARDRGLCDQIQRAAVSVMSNIAEGFERGTKQELINYFYIAKGSCAEVRCQLHVAADVGYVDAATFRNIYGLADESGKLIESFINRVKANSHSGLQYKHVNMAKYKNRKPDPFLMKILDKNPDLRRFYNPEKGEIEFWRKAQEDEAERRKKGNI